MLKRNRSIYEMRVFYKGIVAVAQRVERGTCDQQVVGWNFILLDAKAA